MKSKMRSAVAMLALTCGIATSAMASDNLLINGDFENGIQSAPVIGNYGYWGSLPVGWTGGNSLRFPYTVYQNGDYQYGTAEHPPGNIFTPYPTTLVPNASSGTHFLAVGVDGTTSTPPFYSPLTQLVNVQAGSALTLSYDSLAVGGNGAAVDLYDALTNERIAYNSKTTAVGSNGWTQTSITAITSVSQITVMIHATGYTPTPTRDYLDHVVLTTSAVPEAGTCSMLAMGLLATWGIARRRGRKM